MHGVDCSILSEKEMANSNIGHSLVPRLSILATIIIVVTVAIVGLSVAGIVIMHSFSVFTEKILYYKLHFAVYYFEIPGPCCRACLSKGLLHTTCILCSSCDAALWASDNNRGQ